VASIEDVQRSRRAPEPRHHWAVTPTGGSESSAPSAIAVDVGSGPDPDPDPDLFPVRKRIEVC
jgi:hypothetical protein